MRNIEMNCFLFVLSTEKTLIVCLNGVLPLPLPSDPHEMLPIPNETIRHREEV